MRLLFGGVAALALCACGQSNNAASTEACARSVTQSVEWTNPGAPDTITARADGPSCAQAAVTFVIRNANGDPLWAFASTYFDMTAGGVPPEGAPPVSIEEMDRFLSGWATVELQQSGAFLPEWREGAATLTESATTFAYDTPFERDAYEMLRARDLRTLCYAAAVEAVQCLVVDPLSNAPTMIVAYGP
ncbi:MAG: hypothetical protein AB7O98_00520 [Hyphomonadaceae bacterium]